MTVEDQSTWPPHSNYFHPYRDHNLNDLHQAMAYNSQGQPCIRTTSGNNVNVYGAINWEEIT